MATPARTAAATPSRSAARPTASSRPGVGPQALAVRRKNATRDLVFGLILCAVGGVLSLRVIEFKGDVVAGIGLIVVGVVYLGLGSFKLGTPPRGNKPVTPARR